jgi:hypothetical protein
LVTFKGFSAGASPTKFVFDPKSDKSFPAGMTISPNRNAAWRDDLAAVTFGTREGKANKTPPAAAEGEPKITVSAPSPNAGSAGEKADLVLWHSAVFGSAPGTATAPEHRIHFKPSSQLALIKQDISTLPGIGHFHFALTRLELS